MGPAKDKHGVRENKFFIREEWPFRDKGILINNHIYIFDFLIYNLMEKNNGNEMLIFYKMLFFLN